MRVKNEIVTFNIKKSMKSKYSRNAYLYCADHTAKLVLEQWVDTVDHDRKLVEAEKGDSNEVREVSFYPRPEPVEPLEWKALEKILKPSSVEPPKLELKELPKHLKYAFLQENNQLPVVISFALSATEKARLLEKKGWMIVVKNGRNKLIPQRIVTGWRVCIDYRKLNNVSQKYHFPLWFVDQMLERLAGHEYYCFLDGFSEYFQIPIALEDQEKTTFTFLSFDYCLQNLERMLKRCDETNLVLNWEKCHFMVKEGIILGHKVSGLGIKVDKAKFKA
nr:DNA-directed DNA polymerase [Tanacetum cinerariifolium]